MQRHRRCAWQKIPKVITLVYFLRKATVELTFENSGVCKAWSSQARCHGDGLGDYAKAIELYEVCVCARARACACVSVKIYRKCKTAQRTFSACAARGAQRARHVQKTYLTHSLTHARTHSRTHTQGSKAISEEPR